MKLMVTGGAGFIGSAIIRNLLKNDVCEIINIDALTYAGNLESLWDIQQYNNYHFEKVDICDRKSIDRVLRKYMPDAVMHLAAESHVDRSIEGPSEFIQTNILGTYYLLEATRVYWEGLNGEVKRQFRFHHVSTDEVYGDLENAGGLFTEETAYAPSSPYAASKASADHLVRAWHRTYGLPVVITNCSNNYGPYQFPEKLIPLMILNALDGKPLPVYGDGGQIRDWLFVDDHVLALYKVLQDGCLGDSYNIGGHNEKTNLDVVQSICSILEVLVPNKPNGVNHYQDLISFVPDRPGHDIRYAIDAQKIQHELGWVPIETFESGLKKTVEWYLDNIEWCRRVQDGSYRGERLGLVR